MDSKLKGIRGLSIANIILLSIVIALAIGTGLLCNVIFQALLGEASLRAEVLNVLASDPEAAALTVDQAIGMVTGAIWGFVAVYVIFCGLMITGSAITLSRIKNRPNEIGGCMGWSIMGIVLSILCGLFVSLILYIIATVFISGAKSLVAEGNGIQDGNVGSTQVPTEPAKIDAPTEPAKVDAPTEPAKVDEK